MKIHITNLYGINKNDKLVEVQHYFADAGQSLSFREMSIYHYPMKTDTDIELSKRLDGIISALETDDVVIIQLPTRNGYLYDSKLINKIRTYKNIKIVLLIHDISLILSNDESSKGYLDICRLSEGVIVPSVRDINILSKYEIQKIISYEKINNNNLFYKKILLDAVDMACNDDILLDETNDEIQIGFGLHDKYGNYSVWVGTVMQSIIENTTAPICFHILHDDTLNNDNKRKLTYVAKRAGRRIKYHYLDKTLFDDVKNQVKSFTIGTMFRVMLPELLPNIERIIYLDADLLVNRDIKELWDMDISEYYMAAVPDEGVVVDGAKPLPLLNGEVKQQNYFNAGVLFFNLKNIRQKGNMKTSILEYLQRTKESHLPDQDALNVIYKNKILYLDNSWNCFTTKVRKRKEKSLKKNIYHYAGAKLKLYHETAVDLLYLETISRTPWGSTECKKIIESSMGNLLYRSNLLEKVLHIVADSKKKLVFYGDETYAMKNLYQILSVNDGDYRIIDEQSGLVDGTLPGKPFSTLENETDEYVVFVLPQADGGKSLDKLNALGLKRDEDYFVIPCLLMPAQGGYI